MPRSCRPSRMKAAFMRYGPGAGETSVTGVRFWCTPRLTARRERTKINSS
jgi:hypothetical protein